MSYVSKQHLTDAEFSELLAGEPAGSQAAAHVDACTHCRGELQAVRSSLGSWQNLGTAWARAKAPSCVPVPSRWALGLGRLPSWRAGLAAMTLSGIIAFHYTAPKADLAPPATAAATLTVVAPDRAELAQDNQLMRSIDQELSSQAQPAVPIAELHNAVCPAGRHGSEPLVD